MGSGEQIKSELLHYVDPAWSIMKLPNRVRRREESLPELLENIERLARLVYVEASVVVLETQERPIHRCSVRRRIAPKAKSSPTRMIRSRN